MMTEQHIEEGLGKAYVMAVANRAGIVCDFPEKDYGIDGTFSGILILPDGSCRNSGFKVDFQLKSSVNVEVNKECVSFALPVKNYNDLISTSVGTPRILILFKLPVDRDQWVTISEEEMILRNCAWWHSLYGQEPTSNTDKKTIYIPRNQLFTPQSLRALMDMTARGELR